MALPVSTVVVLGALSALSAVVYGQDGINQNAAAMPLAYGNSSVGPDGPWWALSQAVDFPDQFMSLLPSLSNNTLIINASACSSQTAACPLPTPSLFSWSGADAVSGDNRTLSPEHTPSEWDVNQAALLNMTGSGQYFSQRMTLHPDGDTSLSDILGYLVMAVSNSYTAMFPGGAQYTLDSGFFSLYGGEQLFSWPDVNGFVWSNNRTLSDAYQSGYIPSNSYGLHIGSVTGNVSGSLVLGGYDASRCLTEPIISGSDTVTLTNIALNVSSGGSAYTNSSSGSVPIQNLLRANGSSVSSLDVQPDPGVPYMYLPQDTCDAIAAHLPVTYNSDFNLYFWDTSDAAYQKIISSPHFLAFTFSGGSSGPSSTTINVPFAVMNLTLESPLVSSSTQYFPCSPWTPSSAPYHLGRAFLQGAFLAQNWNSSSLFLAQAPGPGFLPASVKTIAVTDTTLSPATNPPSWDSTWSSTLKALPANSNSTSGTTKVMTSSSSSSSLSGGAIAGIVVGVIVALALIAALVFFLIRKRKRGNAGSQRMPELGEEMRPYYGSEAGKASAPPGYSDNPMGMGTGMPKMAPAAEMSGDQALAEAPAHDHPVEMDASGMQAHELDSGQAYSKR